MVYNAISNVESQDLQPSIGNNVLGEGLIGSTSIQPKSECTVIILSEYILGCKSEHRFSVEEIVDLHK